MKNIRLFLALLLATVVTGCGYNVKAINSFKDSSTSFAKSYGDLVAKTDEYCKEGMRYHYYADDQYTGEDGVKAQVARCDKYSEGLKSVLISKTIVSGYAEALALTVGIDPAYLDSELSKMGEVVKKLQGRDGTVLFNEAEVNLTTLLAQNLAQIYLNHKVKEKTLSIIRENKSLIARHIAIMTKFADDFYDKEHKFLDGAYQGVESELVFAAVTHSPTAKLTSCTQKPGKPVTCADEKLPLAYLVPHRLLLHDIVEKRKGLKSGEGAIKELKTAGSALLVANEELADKFEELDKDATLQSVEEFATKAKALADAVEKVKGEE
ncbi:hypothetical protein [Pseudomonas kilonensis]|uniref:Lipoprotein n=1 Tax=Pseudomonas kilonensis TaxID=132476 RepID=A0ABY0ZIH8_9PSED|nr:hypothetical protein [Pseudomonas kilonensis]SEE76136.1 hypothetical protein SAMN04490188_5584 [Pseudomonas kilonensis]